MNAKIVVSVVAVLAVLGVGAALYYLNRPVAEEASIDNALTALEDSEDEGTEAPATGTEGSVTTRPDAPRPEATSAGATEPSAGENTTAVDDPSGTWAVDTGIGEFNFADATSTFVGFRVAEELSTVGETEAVGRTPSVSGELTIAGSELSAATIEADFTLIASDIPNRDGAMQRAMNVAEHPTGTFTLTDPVDFGGVPVEGETITFSAVGDLTVNGITNPVELEMEAQVAEGNILVVGRTPVVFADYDITAPQAGPVVAIADNGTVELQLWFSRA